MLKHIIVLVILTLIVAIVGAFGVNLSGSPAENKAVRYDEIRLRDFDSIKIGIESYYQDNYRLPSTLDMLLVNRLKTAVPYLKKEPKDPKTKLSYSYNPFGATQYKLCATFETSSDTIEQRKTGITELLRNTNYYGEDRSHPKGEYCFTKTVSAYLERQYDPNPVQTIVPQAQTTPGESTTSAF